MTIESRRPRSREAPQTSRHAARRLPMRVWPTGEATVFQTAPGEFDSRRPLQMRAQFSGLNAGSTRRRSLVRFQPRAHRRVLSVARNPASHAGNTGSTPVHDTSGWLRLLTDQDLRLRISGWWFESTRSRAGKACSKGASCTCNAAVAGSIPVLSTMRRQSDRGTARSPGKREGPVRPRVTARCSSGVVQRKDAGL